MHNNFVDITIIILYFLICIKIGFHKFKSIKTLKDYTLGGSNFPILAIMTTIFVTSIGAGATFGAVEKVYTMGMFFVIALIIMPFSWLIMAQIYGKNIEQFRGCMSIGDIMARLYGNYGRWAANIASIAVSIGVVTMQATAIGYLLNYFLLVPITYGTIAGILLLALYSAFGGVRAVSYTDVFQFIIIIVAIPLVASLAYRNFGGYKKVLHALPKEMLTLDLNWNNIWLFLSLIFFSLLPDTRSPHIQRFLLSRNASQLVSCLRIIAILNLFFVIMITLTGFFIKAKAPDINPNMAFIHFIANDIGTGTKGIAIAGLLLLIMSTADSFLNSGNVLLVHDVIKKLIPLTQKQALIAAKISTFVIAVLSILLSLCGKGIMELYWLLSNFWNPIITIPLTAGFLKFRTNPRSFIASAVLAITFTCVSGYLVGEFTTISLMYGVIGSSIGLFGMHYLQKRQGIDPAAKHKVREALAAKRKSKVGYANSKDQIDEWYKQDRSRSEEVESLLKRIKSDDE